MNTFKVSLTVKNKNCNDFPENEFLTEIAKLLQPLDIQGAEIEGKRCGSVIVDLVLRFNQRVSESDVISVLKTAAQQDNFGSFFVDPESIKQTSPSPTASPSLITSSSTTITGGTQGKFKVTFFFYFDRTCL